MLNDTTTMLWGMFENIISQIFHFLKYNFEVHLYKLSRMTQVGGHLEEGRGTTALNCYCEKTTELRVHIGVQVRYWFKFLILIASQFFFFNIFV